MLKSETLNVLSNIDLASGLANIGSASRTITSRLRVAVELPRFSEVKEAEGTF